MFVLHEVVPTLFVTLLLVPPVEFVMTELLVDELTSLVTVVDVPSVMMVVVACANARALQRSPAENNSAFMEYLLSGSGVQLVYRLARPSRTA